MARTLSSKSVTGADQFSDWESFDGDFNVSISGTWAGTVVVQRSFDEGVTPLDVKEYTANIQEVGSSPESGVKYRIGIAAGNYTSGTAIVRLSK